MYPRDDRPSVSPSTPGPGLAILCLCSAAASALVAGTAVLYQAKLKRTSLNLEINWNVLLAFALIVSIAQSSVTFKQVDYGLGYPISMESAHDLSKFEKLEYANNLLYILALTLLKGVHFLLQHATIMPKPKIYIPIVVTCGMLGFLFAGAFECNAPNFWAVRTGKCFDLTAFWIAFGVFDIITDIYSMLTLIRATMYLQMQSAAKTKLLVVLGTQALPILCAISRLPLVHSAYTSADYTITAYRLAIPTQLQLHLAVVALSMGRIFHFLNTMNAGYLTSAIDAPSRNATANGYGYGKNYVVSKVSPHSSHDHKNSVSESSKNLVPSNYGSTKTVVEAVPLEDGADWKRRTQAREGNDDEHIQVSREYTVTYEHKNPQV